MKLAKGTTHRVSIEKFADKGKSIARIDGMVVFVSGAVPGDEAEISIRRTRKKFAEAEIERLVRPSELRTDPECRYFGWCGGCKWQHVDYQAQLKAKRDSVREAFQHAGGFDDPVVQTVLPAEQTYFYRNKMEFSFSANRWLTRKEIESGKRFDKDFALGLHAPGQFAKVIDIHECHLQSHESVQIVNLVRDLARTQGWDPWDARKSRGLLRHLVIREGKKTGERMINLVLSRFEEEVVDAITECLRSAPSAVTTFVVTINDTPAQTAIGDESHVVFGPGYITDRIGGYSFQIGPQSFFQTNTIQAEKLYEVAREYASLSGSECVYDVYCGAGTIGIYLAGEAARVVGLELVPEAVRDARTNATLNEVSNCNFVQGDVLGTLNNDFREKHGQPDVIILDPPRAGLHPKVVKRVAALGSPRIVYVSCNPQTQARDIAMMEGAYRIDALQPVDLFPHTDHIENVAQLSLAK
ncbi:MAG: 23S rRNA (uracil(1939)-C(5))-methyltransferase RlmD [Rhodothermia bacterium]|nr:23S rRNA (uracil(1939)-C(5))-methyltransferase RlmD [Rhodothermia bacterium]